MLNNLIAQVLINELGISTVLKMNKHKRLYKILLTTLSVSVGIAVAINRGHAAKVSIEHF